MFIILGFVLETKELLIALSATDLFYASAQRIKNIESIDDDIDSFMGWESFILTGLFF